MSDAFRPKPALKRCVLCHQPVARKKLVSTTRGKPAHRSCRSASEGLLPPSRAEAGPRRAPRDISRAELLRRIEALRKKDTKGKPVTPKVKPAVATKQETARGKSASRPASSKAARGRGERPTPPPPPYYGVEAKLIDGRWVQMHPESE